MTKYDLREIAFLLSKQGFGSYYEIMNNWTLDDYKVYLESSKKWPTT